MKTASDIAAHPKFILLRRRRRRLAWGMAILCFLIYAVFVLTMAYAPDWIGREIDPPHATTIGLPIGAGVILFSFVMTKIYTWRANKEFEALTADLRKELVE